MNEYTFCLACGCITQNEKLCTACHRNWKESNLGYAFWLITLPDMAKHMADMAIESGKAKMSLMDSIACIAFPRGRSYGFVPPSNYNTDTLANTCNKKLW